MCIRDSLLPRREYTTIVTIAGYLNVSEKTIQRDLRVLEQWLGQWRINVEKRAGAGVMLSAENIADLLHLDHLLGAECEEDVYKRQGLQNALSVSAPL